MLCTLLCCCGRKRSSSSYLGSQLGALTFLFRFELSHHRLFACQRRGGAEAAANADQAPRAPTVVGWITCCCAVLLCFRLAALVA